MATYAQAALRNPSPRPGRYGDGNNLYLKVAKGGSKSWVFLSRLCGELGLGSATGVGKAGKLSRQQARLKASAIHIMLAEGKDPRDHRKSRGKTVLTFGEVAQACIDGLKPGWKDPDKTATAWTNSLDQHASALTKRAVATISLDDVLAALKPIWLAKPTIADVVRSRIERVLDFAKTKNHRTGDNPARWRGNLALILPKQPKFVKGSHAAMPYQEVAGFMVKLADNETAPSKALQLAVLTATRSVEVTGARWSEFDLANALWTIPASRMKGGQNTTSRCPSRRWRCWRRFRVLSATTTSSPAASMATRSARTPCGTRSARSMTATLPCTAFARRCVTGPAMRPTSRASSRKSALRMSSATRSSGPTGAGRPSRSGASCWAPGPPT